MGKRDSINAMERSRPLADILRPKTLDAVIGQEHLVGKDGIIRKLLASNFLPSLILWGPPGCGKTTLAQLLANLTNAEFISRSAVTLTLAEVRVIMREAKERLEKEKKLTIFFIDEIHRFNKAQQDALLPHVEKGTVIFIGATTENPSFEVISALLSRTRVLVLKPLEETDLTKVTDNALSYLKKSIADDARAFLYHAANGDARSLLNILEIASNLGQGLTLSVKDIEQAAQKKMLQYDTSGDEHYNTISAYIKSMRASDIDAALYYLARMVAAGEDPIFIARRLVVFASEDVLSPTALVVANAVFAACQQVGLPECQENLAAGTVYMAQMKKDRSSYDAYMSALSDVKQFGNLPIPLHVRNAPTKLMEVLDYGKGYTMYDKTSHLPDKIKNKKYYENRT
ncbi:MAG: replication-associated recombination protein A [Patescibacteria group bacterium]